MRFNALNARSAELVVTGRVARKTSKKCIFGKRTGSQMLQIIIL
jgi:hypothetical protein